MNYYNENDPQAAAWIRDLIRAGHIPMGWVDERSIEDVRPIDLEPFTQCHFFAGIGGWSLALRLAGWPDDRPVWTGSCPCQPYSAAGAGNGDNDPRNLWWAFRWLIDQCRPTAVFGEQVASKAGRAWLAGVRADLEKLGYAVGAADLCGASVGAPHIRQRLWWVADSSGQGLPERVSNRRVQLDTLVAQPGEASICSCDPGGMAHPSGERLPQQFGESDQSARPTASSAACRVGHTQGDGRQQRRSESGRRGAASGCGTSGPTRAVHGGWSDADWLLCRDGKWRPVEPGTFPLAHGVSRGMVPGGDPGSPEYANNTAEGRVMRLKGYGNAIVPAVAAQFVCCFLETQDAIVPQVAAEFIVSVVDTLDDV